MLSVNLFISVRYWVLRWTQSPDLDPAILGQCGQEEVFMVVWFGPLFCIVKVNDLLINNKGH